MAASTRSHSPLTADLVAKARRAATVVSRRVERVLYRYGLHLGRRTRCPICGWHGVRFRPSSGPRVGNRLCPGCGSSERYRAFEIWLRRTRPHSGGGRVLEIGPVKFVEPTARELRYEYTSLDPASPLARVRADLCRSPFRDGTFDLIVCFHVLEHIDDDGAALAEIRRLLSPQGIAVLVVPWEPSRAVTLEGVSDDPADNLRLYGQHDHVRIYGADLPERLRAAGLVVDEERWDDLFTPDVLQHFRLAGDDDRFWMCRAPA